MMQITMENTCCFSGYRPEKMPFAETDVFAVSMLETNIMAALLDAHARGYRHFITGMSSGFDLWAAGCVRKLRQAKDVTLICAVPFEEQAKYFSHAWKTCYDTTLMEADQVYLLSKYYHHGCYAERNQYMVARASQLICYHDGKRGGTAQTIGMAKRAGLRVTNLADPQLNLFAY